MTMTRGLSFPADDAENNHPNRPSVPVAELRGHGDGPIHIVRFTADGKYCLTGANDRTVRLWNPTRVDPAYRPPPPAAAGDDALPSALPMQTYADGHLHPVHCVAADASSSVLLSASEKTLLATDLLTAQGKRKWWGHGSRIECVACLGGSGEAGNGGGGGGSGIGEEVYASASYDATVRLWDARSNSREPLMVLDQATDAVTCVAAGRGAGEASIVTSSVDGKIRTYDLRAARVVVEDAVHPVTNFSLSGDGASIAASCLDGTIRLWGTDGDRTKLGRREAVRKLRGAHGGAQHKVECAFSSDGAHVVSGSECGAVAVYPVGGDGTARARTLRRHAGPTCSVATCPRADRPWLAVSASYDGTAVVWADEARGDRCLVE